MVRGNAHLKAIPLALQQAVRGVDLHAVVLGTRNR
jgi:hypothetical protein